MDASGRTFRVNFTAEATARLRDRVKEKLKEFMGDYTDDTLVEYVIVLLRNGRQKEEARKELDVFLGDDSESFVSWLWDHLTKNLHLYMQTMGDAGMREMGKHGPFRDIASGDPESLLDHEKEKSAKLRTRHNREWKGLVHDDARPLILRSSAVDDGRLSDRRRSPVRASSPMPQIQKKRNRQDDESTMKREGATRPKLDAPRRLLQFAVRDAVRTVQKAPSRPEPSLKRLRSEVYATTMDIPSDEPPRRTRSVAIAAGAAASAVKAAAEAAEDVAKGRGPGNVFDRLSHGSGGAYVHTKNQSAVVANGVDEDSDWNSRPGGYQQRSEHNRIGRDTMHTTVMDQSFGLATDSGSENDFDNMGSLSRADGRSRSAETLSVQKDKNVIMTQQSSVQTANETTNTTLRNNQNPPPIAGSNASQKTLNISINVNTWKPQHYQVSGQHKEVGNQVAVEGTGEDTVKLNTQVIKDTDMDSAPKKDEMVRRDDPNVIQKPVPSSHGAYSSGRPADDADSRTVFVSNVHFAASKDTLSRHFNKFGEVLKVIIVTDATTGQPKGSAYVEFLRKESAELALSLNGTSFMSRILKVVMRSAAHHEAAAMMSWPRIARSSAFPPRLGRMPYPRGLMTTNLRARLPLKPGPRSLQWKRDSPGGSTNEDLKSSQNPSTPTSATISPAGRNLTYVRPDPKTDGSMGLA